MQKKYIHDSIIKLTVFESLDLCNNEVDVSTAAVVGSDGEVEEVGRAMRINLEVFENEVILSIDQCNLMLQSHNICERDR